MKNNNMAYAYQLTLFAVFIAMALRLGALGDWWAVYGLVFMMVWTIALTMGGRTL